MNEVSALPAAEEARLDEDGLVALSGEITELLHAWREPGMPPEALVRCLYPHLRRIAAGQLSGSAAGRRPLDTTELVHEAFLRLANQRLLDWRNRGHFFRVAARLIRRVLVDEVRERRTAKRGGALERAELLDATSVSPQAHPDLLALDQALDRLAAEQPAVARVVELRYFAGLTISEVAESLGIGRTTVVRHWRWARAWLRAELGAQPAVPALHPRETLEAVS
ncbi:MAG: ECF-type sigma factor [Acidobacteriota bacterium]